MTTKNLLGLSFAAAIALIGCNTEQECTTKSKQEPYKAEWTSLAKHNTPQWLMDAKFGMYCHWGPQSVQEAHRDADYKQTMDVVEAFDLWKAEKFDPAEWAQLFKETGAQFAGPIAEHCTGCLNWDSDISSWNSMNYGPKRDILGELAREIKKRDMKLMASFHTVTYGSTWGEISKEDRTFMQPILEHDSINRVDTRWLQGWVERVEEATTKYGVDLVWFDTSYGSTIGGDLRGFIDHGKYKHSGTPRTRIGSVHEAAQQQMIANYFNYGLKENRDVEVVYKSYDIPYNIGMRDIENGNLDGAQYDPWMTDVNMLNIHQKYWTNWFYHPLCGIKDANFIVDMLIDVVSKNGRMLLSIPPKADGSFPQAVVKELKGIGEWMKINSEGIYATTPWCIYGEGPTFVKHPGHHGHTQARGNEMAKFTADDVRYTTKGRDIYAFVLGTPESGKSMFAALGSENKLYPGEIKDIVLLGSDAKIEWEHQADALVVNFPKDTKEQIAYCFKVIR